MCIEADERLPRIQNIFIPKIKYSTRFMYITYIPPSSAARYLSSNEDSLFGICIFLYRIQTSERRNKFYEASSIWRPSSSRSSTVSRSFSDKFCSKFHSVMKTQNMNTIRWYWWVTKIKDGIRFRREVLYHLTLWLRYRTHIKIRQWFAIIKNVIPVMLMLFNRIPKDSNRFKPLEFLKLPYFW